MQDEIIAEIKKVNNKIIAVNYADGKNVTDLVANEKKLVYGYERSGFIKGTRNSSGNYDWRVMSKKPEAAHSEVQDSDPLIEKNDAEETFSYCPDSLSLNQAVLYTMFCLGYIDGFVVEEEDFIHEYASAVKMTPEEYQITSDWFDKVMEAGIEAQRDNLNIAVGRIREDLQDGNLGEVLVGLYLRVMNADGDLSIEESDFFGELCDELGIDYKKIMKKLSKG